MAGRLEIQWSPIKNKFITWGSEVCLYDVVSSRDQCVPFIKLSNTTGAHLLATNSAYHYVKCIDIYPKSDVDLLLAIGQANGKIVLSTFGASVFDSQGLVGKELVPRHQRQCNALAWNRIEVNKIVAGLEKNRSDNCVLLWDITKTPIIGENGPIRPVSEYGLSETTQSLAWFNTNSKLLAAGMNNKNIRIIDFRDPIKAVNSTLTKAVFGLSMEQHSDKYLASFTEHQVHVWDTRNFEKPLLTLSHLKPLIKVAWCPTKQNLLGTLQRDSTVINLYDIQHTVVGNEEIEPSVLERVVVPHSDKPPYITSFSWHHSDENRFLTIALSGQITDYTVFDRITLNWANNSHLVWTCGRKTLKYITDSSVTYNILQDISQKIKHRACIGYGLKDELWKNGELVDDEALSNVWNLLHSSSKLVETVLRGSSSKHPGIKTILKLDPANNKSEMVTLSWDLGNVTCNASPRIYKHEDRDKALYLCGWYFDKESNTLTKFIEQLEREQAYTRAAAIAVFNLQIKMAIDILNRGSENSVLGTNLNVVAMALAGFSEDKSSMWRQFCASPKTKLNDPYLRALFAFLTAENFNYDGVLYENGMTVEDRVAFACIFLPDNKLYEYLKTLTAKLIEDGSLDGLLLTGNTREGIAILQNYLDTTGDIQSTALIAVRAFNSELLQDTGKDWIMRFNLLGKHNPITDFFFSYRNLLDSWQLWNERAMFDIMLSTQRPNDKPPQQVYVSCNFCGKSISAYMQGLNRGRGPFSRMGGTANKLKMSSCPSCRKPLPRCAICLMHMGTTTGDQLTTDSEGSKIIEFSHWFTWCQTCRHGGHASHMIHWFKQHSECPVTACTCRCFSVDAI